MHTFRALRLAFWVLLLLDLSGCQAQPKGAPSDLPAIEIKLLGTGLWQHTSYYTYPDGGRFPSNGLIVQRGQQLLLVDTAWGELQTIALLQKIEATIGLPVATAVVTHAHYDRLAGVDVLKSSGVSVLGSPLTRTIARQSGLPVPEQLLEGVTTPHSSRAIGNVEVVSLGPAHSPDNLAVWLPAQRVLFGGCAVRSGTQTTIGPLHDADPRSWLKAIEFLQQRFSMAELVVPGHGDVGDIGLLEHTRSLLKLHMGSGGAGANKSFKADGLQPRP